MMGALGCVTLNSAYRSIDWKTIVLIVGMLPFSIALQRTGGVDLAADALRALTSGAGDRAVLAALFAVTALLGMFISNTATAVLMAPVALAFANETHVSPYPFAMIVALAASTAFMTPVSSPVNTLVVAPGNYTLRRLHPGRGAVLHRRADRLRRHGPLALPAIGADASRAYSAGAAPTALRPGARRAPTVLVSTTMMASTAT